MATISRAPVPKSTYVEFRLTWCNKCCKCRSPSHPHFSTLPGKLRRQTCDIGTVDGPWGVKLGLSGTYRSGAPFNITTGLDDNGDLIFNDRPAGVERNSGEAPDVWTVNVRLAKVFPVAGAELELIAETFNLFDEVNETGSSATCDPGSSASRRQYWEERSDRVRHSWGCESISEPAIARRPSGLAHVRRCNVQR